MMESAIEVSRKNIPASLDVYRWALSKQPRTTIAILLQEALIAANDKAGAEKMVEKWIAEHPRDAEFRFHLGDLAMAREDYEVAQKYFRNVIALQPENVAALNNIAWAMAKLKQPGAIRFAEQAVKLNPDTPGLMDTLATTLAADKQFDKAVDVQKKVLALASPPTDQVFRLNLARIYLQAGNTAAARTELQTLEKLGATFRSHLEVSRLLKTL
jgi:tetratricopeptide (TPR) repeat protein